MNTVIGDFLKNIQNQKIADRHFEEKLYEAVGQELLDSGVLKQGLWIKALADCDGSESRAKALYIKYRAQAILDEVDIINDTDRKETARKASNAKAKKSKEEATRRRNERELAQKELENKKNIENIENKISNLNRQLSTTIDEFSSKIYRINNSCFNPIRLTELFTSVLFIFVMFLIVPVMEYINHGGFIIVALAAWIVGMIGCITLRIKVSEYRARKNKETTEYKELVSKRDRTIESIKLEIEINKEALRNIGHGHRP